MTRLSQSLSKAVVIAAAASATATVPATCTNVQDGVIVGQDSIKTLNSSSAGDCCQSCFAFDGCVAFTFASDSKECFLKDNSYGTTSHSNRISASIPSRTVATRACQSPSAYKYCDTSIPMADRVKALISMLQPAEKPPLLTARESPMGAVPRIGLPEYDWGTNCIHGVQSRCGAQGKCPTSFTTPVAQGAAFNRTLWRDMAAVTGKELRALWLADVGENHNDNLPHLGLDCWSPNININRDPRWGRNLETPGECPYLNGQYGQWHTEGLQKGEDPRFLQAVVTLKHFAAYSVEKYGNVTRHDFDAKMSHFDLVDTYLKAWKNTVEEGGAKGVMCSYNAVNGVPSCANQLLIDGFLRNTWNFSGYVTSDSGAVEDIYAQHHYNKYNGSQGVAAAIKAGCDVDSSLDKGHSSTGSPYTWFIPDALKEGLITDADVDTLLERTLRLRFELGLFDPIEDQPYWHYDVAEAVDTESSQALNHLGSRQGLVLLQNEGNTLPLKEGGKLAVVGPHALAKSALLGNYLGQICPAAYGDTSCIQTPFAALQELNTQAGGSTVTEPGCAVDSKDTSGFAAAIAAAKEADAVVLMMGIDISIEDESHDRTSITLPGVQMDLIQQVAAALKGSGKPLVLVMLNGGALAIDWVKANPSDVGAVLEAFYPGKIGGAAVADAIFGRYNPGGKLPYTVYGENYTKEVDFLSMDMTAKPGRGYRYYQGTPLWPFGFGLSYTTFHLSLGTQRVAHQMQTTALAAATNYTVYVGNTGQVAGDEVVQAYFTPDAASVHPSAPPPMLPYRQLFDFERLHVAVGETNQVTFSVHPDAFTLVDGNGNMVIVPGKYNLQFTDGVAQVLAAEIILTGPEVTVQRFPSA